MCPISKSIHSRRFARVCHQYVQLWNGLLSKISCAPEESLERTLGNWHRSNKKSYSVVRPGAIFIGRWISSHLLPSSSVSCFVHTIGLENLLRNARSSEWLMSERKKQSRGRFLDGKFKEWRYSLWRNGVVVRDWRKWRIFYLYYLCMVI